MARNLRHNLFWTAIHQYILSITLCLLWFGLSPLLHASEPPSGIPESSVPYLGNPFTPAGQATVIDNAFGSEGKEFFTIETENKQVFYLVIDRERGRENVYLLVPATEDDLLSFVDRSQSASWMFGGLQQGYAPSSQPDTVLPSSPAPVPKDNSPSSIIVMGIIMLIGVGGAVYFKLVKPRLNAAKMPPLPEILSNDPDLVIVDGKRE